MWNFGGGLLLEKFPEFCFFFSQHGSLETKRKKDGGRTARPHPRAHFPDVFMSPDSRKRIDLPFFCLHGNRPAAEKATSPKGKEA